MANSHFFEIKDEAIVSKILDVAGKHRVTVTVWLRNQQLKFDTRINKFMHFLKRLYLGLPPGVSQDKLKNALLDQGSNEVMASLQIETIHFFFKTNYVRMVDSQNFQIEIPKSIYKMQRRAHLRIPFTRHEAPRLSIPDPKKVDLSKISENATIPENDMLYFRVIDIGAGGLAIAARLEDKILFTKGNRLQLTRFKLRGIEIEVNALVKHVVEKLNDQRKPMLQVGIQFLNLKPKDEKIINKFAFDESRRLFTLLY